MSLFQDKMAVRRKLVLAATLSIAATFLASCSDKKEPDSKDKRPVLVSTSSFQEAFSERYLNASSSRLAGRGDVIVVGDSLEVLTKPFLERRLRDFRLTHSAVPGYTSKQIFSLFEKEYTRRHSVVVFDAGTNDDNNQPWVLRKQIRKVADIIGPRRCLVVPTLYVFVRRGVSSKRKNDVILSLKRRGIISYTPSWGVVPDRRPDLMKDRIHPNDRGARLRARKIAKRIKRCFTLAVPKRADF